MPDQPESPGEILKRYALALMENAAANQDEYEIDQELLERRESWRRTAPRFRN